MAIVAGLAGLASGLAALWRARAQGPLYQSQAHQAISDAATQLIGPLRDELNDLRRRVQNLEDENRILRWQVSQLQMENYILRDAVRRLAHQVQALGGKPVIDPETLEERKPHGPERE